MTPSEMVRQAAAERDEARERWVHCARQEQVAREALAVAGAHLNEAVARVVESLMGPHERT